MTDNGLITTTNSNGYGLNLGDRETIDTLKATVARGTTDTEFKLFLEMVKATSLNPFKREIWCIKTQTGLQIMTGINGFYEIANRHPEFDGMEETEIVEENGKIIKATAKVWRKDRRFAQVSTVYFEEYAKPYGNWKTMPRVMIAKCAEATALRKAFPQQLNGLYTAEEMPREFSASASLESQKQVAPPTEEHYYNFVGMSDDEYEKAVKGMTVRKAVNIRDRIWCSPVKSKHDSTNEYLIEGLPTEAEVVE